MPLKKNPDPWVIVIPEPDEEKKVDIQKPAHRSSVLPNAGSFDAYPPSLLANFRERVASAVESGEFLPQEEDDDRDTWAPLEGIEAGRKFSPEVQSAIRHLILLARSAVKSGNRVDFYRDYRLLREQEKERSPEEKLHLFAYLSILLSGRQFLINDAIYTVIYCSERDLDKEVPKLRARRVELSDQPEGTEASIKTEKVVHLLELLAGIILQY